MIGVLEAGLCALVVLAPLPFGAVGPFGRGALELGAFALTALWTWNARREEAALPPRAARAGIALLLVQAALQIVPLGPTAVAAISPFAARLAPEPGTLSVAPEATASALATGAALAGVLLVATTVVARRGARRIAGALLVSAAFQGLYGLLVLASGHDKIWNVPKTAYLESATGTFVNRNHFAGFVAGALPAGLGLIVVALRRARGRKSFLDDEGSRALLFGLLALVAAAGVLLSSSRAGTALAVAAIAATLAVCLGGPLARRAAIILAIVGVAAIPLLDLGADRLLERYADASSDLSAAGGRLDVWRGAAELARRAPWLGCGFGTFTWAFPAVSGPAVRLHYTHAHNDALQLLAEGGALAGIAALLVLVPLARAWVRVVGAGSDPVVVGAACGLAALALHALVDFGAHIPAIATLAAVLAGILFGATWTAKS